MTRILLLSDTHGYLDEQIENFCLKADEIWHVGDIGDIKVTDKLKSLKPLRAVYGNIDGAKARAEFKLDDRFYCEGVEVWMTHIGGYPNRYSPRVKPLIAENPPKLFISGHSHILKVMMDKKLNCLHMNPGAAGKHGFHKVRTMLRFEINQDQIQNLEVIELGLR